MKEDQKIQKIFTVGYGDKEFENFVDLLKGEGIELVVDVRSFPKSKWPEYKKENLKQKLPEENTDYIHLKGLGGYRDEGYKEYMKTENFENALSRLEDLAQERETAIMCLESYPSGCHRRYIAQELGKRGWKIIHLVGKKGRQEVLD